MVFFLAAFAAATQTAMALGLNEENGSRGARIGATPGRAAPGPEPYGGGVRSGDGSGRPQVGRDRAPSQGNTGFPPGHRRRDEDRDGDEWSGRQIGRRRARAEAARKTSGAVMIVLRGDSTTMFVTLMGARIDGHDRRGKADRTAAHQGKHAQDHQKTLCQPPHVQNLSCPLMLDNRLREKVAHSPIASVAEVQGSVIRCGSG